MTNLDRLLEKSRELRGRPASINGLLEYELYGVSVSKTKDEMLTIAVEALDKMVVVSLPLYAGSDIFLPVLKAIAKIEALAAKALGESG